MLTKKQFIEEEKDCASMLGMSLEEYREDVKNTKIPPKEKVDTKIEYDNSILKDLGLDESMLKKRKYNI